MSQKQPTKEELIQIFNIIDKDKSGSIDTNELYDALGIIKNCYNHQIILNYVI